MAQRSFGLVFLLALAAGVGCPHAARAETGYDLWLRYVPIREAGLRDSYRRSASSVAVPLASPTGRAIADELRRGLEGMLGAPVRVSTRIEQDGAVLVGTPAASPLIAGFGWSDRFERAGDEGFVIRSAFAGARQVTVIASRSEAGALYGAFHFLRLLQTGQPIARLDIAERPRVDAAAAEPLGQPRRHASSAGYAGRSLWDWARAARARSIRASRDYARANASIGINGTVLNNVNANPRSLTRPYLEKAAAHRAASSAVRHPRLPVGQLRRAAHARRPRDRRSARPARRAAGGGPRRTRSTASSPTSAGSSSRPTARGSPARRTTAARTPTAPTCWPTRSRRTAAS